MKSIQEVLRGVLFLPLLAISVTAYGQRSMSSGPILLDDGSGHTLTIITSSMPGNETFTFPTNLPFTPGSILFGNTLSEMDQDNSKFFWDNTNLRLGIGNTSPQFTLDVTGTGRITGTLTPGAVLDVPSGGTNASTVSAARANLGLAILGANGDITSLTNLTTPLPITEGGTGATTATDALTNLGAAASGANSDITSLTGLTTALPIAEGGTAATSAATARTSLLLAGSGVNSDITSLTGLTTALPVGEAGTGTTAAPTQSGVVYGSSTSQYATTGVGTSGQVITSTGTSAPAWQAVPEGIPSGAFIAFTDTAAHTGFSYGGARLVTDGIFQMAAPPEDIHNGVSVGLNGNIYVFFHPSFYPDTLPYFSWLLIYDTYHNTWHYGASSNDFYYPYDMSCASWHGKIHVMTAQTHEIYDPATDTWTNGTSATFIALEYERCAIVGDSLFMIGGVNGYTENDCLDLNTGVWSQRTPDGDPQHGQDQHINSRVVALNGLIHKFYDKGQVGHRVYDPVNDSWSDAPNPFTLFDENGNLLSGVAVVAIGNKIHLFGGSKVSSTGFLEGRTDHQIYDDATQTWTELFDAPQVFADGSGDLDMAAAASNGVIYLTGGLYEKRRNTAYGKLIYYLTKN